MPDFKGFLNQLSAGDRAQVESHFAAKSFGRGESILTQDDSSRDILFLLEGRARVTVYSVEGKSIDYRDIGEGDLFGELSAIDGRPRSASVVALTPCRVAQLYENRLPDLLSASPAFRDALLVHLTGTIRRLTERVFEFSTLVVRDRLLREIWRMARETGVAEGTVRIEPAPTHGELASRISTHREAVSREMSALSKAGVVTKAGSALVIADIEAFHDAYIDAV